MIRFFLPLFLLGLAAAGCGPAGEAPAPRSAPPPLFVISIDTLRADRLPAWGYPAGSTPALDRLRADSVLVRNAFANVPLTLPSHASIFTGELPHTHGVRDNIGYALDPRRPTLASLLRRRGYRTGGAVSSFVLRRDTGIASGFDFWDDGVTAAAGETISSWQRDGDRTRAALVRWLDTEGPEPPFGFLHLYEPHFPYAPPEPFASRFEDPYDGEVAYADAIVGRFLDDLRARGLYDRSLIVVLSDHGEGLGDHGELEHGVFLYREAIHVPLLVKLPGNARAGEEIVHPVSLTDVLPTILARAGGPAAAAEGRDLFAEPAPERLLFAETHYPRLHYGWSELFSAIDGRVHYIHAPAVELYDLAADPAERRNLAGVERRVVAAMRRRVEAIVREYPFEAPQVADAETARKLAALGYLGGGAAASGTGADPKEKIELLAVFGRGAGALQRGALDEAIAIGRSIVGDEPGFLQGWGLMAEGWRRKGNPARALAALEEQMKRSPGNPQTALGIAALQLEMGRYEEARRHAELALEYAPSLAWETIANVELARGRFDAASAAAGRALDAAPLRMQALMIASQIERARGDRGAELALLDRVAARLMESGGTAIPELHFRRGEALLRLRRAAEAEAAFRSETEAFPRNSRAWANLALVVAGLGREAEARAILDRALRENPGPEMERTAREVRRILGEAAREQRSAS